ncbi:MAG: hypothetical protein H6577_18575 [Lewinellaceae bacterium]|nr:hypothetical protein [Saprospiraceae bacterium]MCB9340131.1 hypothetical protein [Lewinellaceae bacterium]
MKRLIFVAVATTLLAASACQPTTNPDYQAEEKVHDEIMAIHDEVMPKMGEVNRLGRELKKAAEKLPATDEYNKANIAQAIRQLEKADDAMGRWMANYQHPSKKRGELNHEYIMMYLDREKEKVELVRTLTAESMSTAKDILAGVEKTE